MTQQLGALTVLVEDSDSSTLWLTTFFNSKLWDRMPPSASKGFCSYMVCAHTCTHTYKLFKHTHAYIFLKKNIKGCLLSFSDLIKDNFIS